MTIASLAASVAAAEIQAVQVSAVNP